MSDRRLALEQRIRTAIPISEHMDFRILRLNPCSIVVSGGAEHNVNVHGTAFAGSLYAICTLAAWGLLSSRLPPDAALVLAEGRIKYRAPVHGAIEAHCAAESKTMDGFLDALERMGKSRIELAVTVQGEHGAAVEFVAGMHASCGWQP